MSNGSWGTPMCQNLLPYSYISCYIMWDLNTWDQLRLCVLNLDLVLGAGGSYGRILIGESGMIQFMEHGLEGNKTGFRKTKSGDCYRNTERKSGEPELRPLLGQKRRENWEPFGGRSHRTKGLSRGFRVESKKIWETIGKVGSFIFWMIQRKTTWRQ